MVKRFRLLNSTIGQQYGKWEIEHGKWEMESVHLKTGNRIENLQLPVVKIVVVFE